MEGEDEDEGGCLLNRVLIFLVYELIQREDVFVQDLVEVVAIESSVVITVYQYILEHYSTEKRKEEKFFQRKRMLYFFLR